MNGKELANAFGDAVNSSNWNNEEFATYFARQHRTLQQSMMRAMLTCVELAASDEYRTDGRNESTAKQCKMLMQGYKFAVQEVLIEQGMDDDKAYTNAKNYKPSALPTV